MVPPVLGSMCRSWPSWACTLTDTHQTVLMQSAPAECTACQAWRGQLGWRQERTGLRLRQLHMSGCYNSGASIVWSAMVSS